MLQLKRKNGFFLTLNFVLLITVLTLPLTTEAIQTEVLDERLVNIYSVDTSSVTANIIIENNIYELVTTPEESFFLVSLFGSTDIKSTSVRWDAAMVLEWKNATFSLLQFMFGDPMKGPFSWATGEMGLHYIVQNDTITLNFVEYANLGSSSNPEITVFAFVSTFSSDTITNNLPLYIKLYTDEFYPVTPSQQTTSTSSRDSTSSQESKTSSELPIITPGFEWLGILIGISIIYSSKRIFTK